MKHLSFGKIIATVLLLTGAAAPAAARTISGRVLSDTDSTAVVGAVCRLTSDGKFLAGAEANHKGDFQIETEDKGALDLEIGMAGFSSTDIHIAAGGKNLKLGTIYLSEGTTLSEVVISGNTVVDSKGRTIVYPSEADVKASSTSLSLFQKLPLPGLESNEITRTITVDNQTPTILINGIRATQEEVNAIQPKDILKVEFSRIPPIRYGGSGGFINITLKRRNDGGSVYTYGRSALTTAFMDASLNASYHQGPSQFTVLYTPSWRNYQKVYDHSIQSFIGDDFRVDLDKSDRNPFNYFSNNAMLKYNFSPNLKTLFSATVSTTALTSKRQLYGTTADSELGTYDNYSLTRNRNNNTSLDLFFRRDFDHKNSLEVEVVGTLSNQSSYYNSDYFIDPEMPSNYLTDVTSRRMSLISEVSYNQEFKSNTSLGVGIQNTLSHSKNNYVTTDYEPILTENHNYAYARLGQQIGRLWLSVSTGFKFFWTNNDANHRHFARSLSTFQASWNISDKWNLQGSFRYSPGIPSLSSLTDYMEQITPYLVTNGNPALKASNTFVYQISPSFRSNKVSVYLSANYSSTTNPTISDVTYLGNKLFLSQTVNARREWMAGGEAYIRIGDFKGFGASISLSLAHYETLGEYYNLHLTSFSPYFYLWYSRGKFTVSYMKRFPGKTLSGTVVYKGENNDGLTVEFRPDNHWAFGASWFYMFDRKGTSYPQWNYSHVSPEVSTRRIHNNGNMVTLTVQYVTDFGSIFRSAKRNLNNSDKGSSIRSK